MAFRRVLGVSTFAILASACQNMQALVRHESLPSSGGALLVDARSRAILSGHEPTHHPPSAAPAERDRIVCAEPSPDALSALAFGAGGTARQEGVGEASGSLSVSESAASIGLRTQSIQLLRDGMYRLCEGYMNGAITASQYVILWNRYQEMMLGLVAIEQLTGAMRAPATSIGSEALALSAQAQQTLEVAQRRLAQLQTDKTNAHARLATLQAADRNPAASAAELQQAQNDANAADDALTSQQNYVNGLQGASNAATQQAAQQLAVSTAGSTRGSIEHSANTTGYTDGNAAAIATVVDRITQRLTTNNFLAMSCMPVLQRELVWAEGSTTDIATLAPPDTEERAIAEACQQVAAQAISAELMRQRQQSGAQVQTSPPSLPPAHQ